MINLKNKKHKIINKVVWVWTQYLPNKVFEDTPEELQPYFNQGYTVKDFNVTTYNSGTAQTYMFILEKTID